MDDRHPPRPEACNAGDVTEAASLPILNLAPSWTGG